MNRNTWGDAWQNKISYDILVTIGVIFDVSIWLYVAFLICEAVIG